MRNKYLLANYFFLFSLLLLFTNDHFFKANYSNWLTGKLSDVFGVIVLTFLLAYVFPKLKQNSVFVTILLFAFWKSPISESFINFYNSFSPFSIMRIVDYTDLVAFVFLPIPYVIIKNMDRFNGLKIEKISSRILVFPTLLILMSTSPPRNYTYHPLEGNLFFKDFKIELDQISSADIINTFQKKNIVIHKDTIRVIYSGRYRFTQIGRNLNNLQSLSIENAVTPDSARAEVLADLSKSNFYIIDSLQIGDDDIKDIKFEMYATPENSTILNIQNLRTDKNISRKNVKRKLTKMYMKALEMQLSN